jgi:signal transduction histidine kinase
MVALAFLIPLALVAQEIARDRALTEARQQSGAIIAALAVSADRDVLARAVAATTAGSAGRLSVHLPGGAPVGTARAGAADIDLAGQRRQPITAQVPGGLAYLQPTALEGGQVAVVEVYVPDGELHRGVMRAWWAMTAVAVLLVVGSVAVADRLGARIVAATHDLAAAARALGAGDLTARVRPSGPPELASAGGAFNAMADRVVSFVDAERELAADLSHRLRTPLTALRLDAETLPGGSAGERIRQAVDVLQAEVDEIIRSARRPGGRSGTERSDLVEVVADRLAFWSVLAEDHGREWAARQGARAVWLRVPRADLVAAVDAMLGNVFQHTPEGTPFRVSVTDNALVVDDAGPGIGDPEEALRRGLSGSGSTGLGLDIARRVAAAAGGSLRIDRSELGGARVTLQVSPDEPAQ